MDGLDLFNDDTCPSGHISRPTPVFMKNFHGSSDICPMGFIYSIQICEISHQTFGPSHRKCPTCPMIFVNTATQVNVSQSCFNSLNILLKLNYIVQVWELVEVNCVISDRRIPLLAGIPQCKSRELSRRGYSMSQLCSIHHDIPVTLHTPGAYDQWSVFDHNGDK